VLPTVHRTAVENSHISRSAFRLQGHAKRISDLIIESNRQVRAGRRDSRMTAARA
jgi:hypothetical protein